MGQQRVQEHAVPQPVDAEDDAEPAAALLAEQHEPPRLEPLGAPRARGLVASSERAALGLRLGAQRPVAPDPVEVAARGLVRLGLGQGPLGLGQLRLQPADLAEVLELGERGLDDAPDRRLVAHGLEQERRRAVAEPELAFDRLGRAVDDGQDVGHAVAGVERDDALAHGVDAAAAGPSGHLGQLVVGEAAEAAVGPLGDALEHDAARRHVDAETHRLGGEDDPDQPALEEQLGQPLEAGQDPGVVNADPELHRPEDHLVHVGGPQHRVLLHRLADRLLDLVPPGAIEERPPLAQDVLQGALAADPAEDEVDGGEPLPALQLLDHRGHGRDTPRVEAPPPIAVPAVLDADQPGLAGPHGVERVNPGGQVRHEVRERHRAMGMDDRDDRPVDQADPLGDLVDVGDGGGERRPASRPWGR